MGVGLGVGLGLGRVCRSSLGLGLGLDLSLGLWPKGMCVGMCMRMYIHIDRIIMLTYAYLCIHTC